MSSFSCFAPEVLVYKIAPESPYQCEIPIVDESTVGQYTQYPLGFSKTEFYELYFKNWNQTKITGFDYNIESAYTCTGSSSCPPDTINIAQNNSDILVNFSVNTNINQYICGWGDTGQYNNIGSNNGESIAFAEIYISFGSSVRTSDKKYYPQINFNGYFRGASNGTKFVVEQPSNNALEVSWYFDISSPASNPNFSNLCQSYPTPYTKYFNFNLGSQSISIPLSLSAVQLWPQRDCEIELNGPTIIIPTSMSIIPSNWS